MLDDFREWLSDNLRYILLGLAVILAVVIIVCIVRLVGGRGSSNNSAAADAPATTASTDATGTAQAASESNAAQTQSESTSASSGLTTSLVQDDAAVLSVITQYYTAVAAHDETTLSQIVVPWNDTVRDKIMSATIMESYNNLTTYSKPGLTDGSYVVYAYYEGKISGINTQVPSLSLFYLITNADGTLVISSDRESDQEINDFVTKTTADADVQNLISTVNAQYNAALSSDPDLASYVNSNSGNTGTTSETSAQEESSASETTSSVMTATAGLNIRQEPNTSSAILGTVIEGTDVNVLEDAGDGWVHISYDSTAGTIEGYVMLQYLTSSDSSGTSSADTAASSDGSAASDSSSDSSYTDSAEPAPSGSDNVAA